MSNQKYQINFNEVLPSYTDVVDSKWTQRHFKAMHTLGLNKYHELASRAREGKNPKALMAHLLNGELNKPVQLQIDYSSIVKSF